MARKKKPVPVPLEPLVPRFAFGKFKGRTVEEVMHVESTYLAWFVDQVDGCEELKEAIKAHPRFRAVQASHLESRRKRQQAVEWQQGQFSEPTIDSVCDELFREPGKVGEQPDALPPDEPAAEGTRLEIVQGWHYGDYVQSGENLYCDKAGEEVYRFRVCDQSPPYSKYEPWFVTPETDLSAVSLKILEEMDTQMYYCGECDDDESRETKFSRTRKHIQGAISQRTPS